MTLDSNHPNSEIQAKLEAIYSLHTKKMDFRLDKGPYRDLLTAIGNPHLHLPPAIHVAGTNGKGSTIVFLKSLCEAAGMSVHAYTSPHLLKFNERITLNGAHISDAVLNHYLDMIETTNAGAPLTFFEYTTALAFKAFADHPADICLLETGLGGRLDCTNVIEKPMATVITSIGHDHMDWLGHDITDIAREKAGIMKAGSPCFIAPQDYDVMHVFEKKAKDVGCDLHAVKRLDDLTDLGLAGEHQKDNASVALKTLETLGHVINRAALAVAKWPARMEKISDSPEIWFDCGHNQEGAEAIAKQLKQWRTKDPDRHIHLVLALARDKDPNDFLAPLWPYIDHVTCVDLLNARNPQSAEELRIRINAQKPVKIGTIDDVFSDANDITMITGSLYLYEHVKTL